MPLVSLANRRFLPAVTSAVLACLVAATAAAAQTTTAATEHVIASSVLREPRTVRVVLPPNYAVSTRRHPVL